MGKKEMGARAVNGSRKWSSSLTDAVLHLLFLDKVVCFLDVVVLFLDVDSLLKATPVKIAFLSCTLFNICFLMML